MTAGSVLSAQPPVIVGDHLPAKINLFGAPPSPPAVLKLSSASYCGTPESGRTSEDWPWPECNPQPAIPKHTHTTIHDRTFNVDGTPFSGTKTVASDHPKLRIINKVTAAINCRSSELDVADSGLAEVGKILRILWRKNAEMAKGSHPRKSNSAHRGAIFSATFPGHMPDGYLKPCDIQRLDEGAASRTPIARLS